MASSVAVLSGLLGALAAIAAVARGVHQDRITREALREAKAVTDRAVDVDRFEAVNRVRDNIEKGLRRELAELRELVAKCDHDKGILANEVRLLRLQVQHLNPDDRLT